MTAKGALSFATVVLFLSLPAVGQTTQPASAVSGMDYATLIEGDATAGLTILKDQIKANPRDSEAMHAAGVLLLKSGKAAEASGFFARAAAAGVGGPALSYNQSLALLRTGQAIKAAGLMNKHFQSGGAADERFLDLFGDSVDRATRAGAISTTSTKKNWDDALAARIQSLEQGRPGMKKWGTRWLTAGDWGPIATSLASYQTKVKDAESNYDDAVDARKRAEDNSRDAQRAIPDVSSDESTSYKRYKQNEASRASDELRRARERERNAKKDLDQIRNQAPRPTWEDKHAPIWGKITDVGTLSQPSADAGATLARGMSVTEVQAIMGVQASTVTESEDGYKYRLYDLNDRTVRVRFRDERLVSYEEQVKTKNSSGLQRGR